MFAYLENERERARRDELRTRRGVTREGLIEILIELPGITALPSIIHRDVSAASRERIDLFNEIRVRRNPESHWLRDESDKSRGPPFD